MSEISHKEIYDRLVTLETKVDRIDANTSGMVTAFQAASGAFTVLEFIAKLAKPVLWIIGVGAAIAAIWDSIKIR